MASRKRADYIWRCAAVAPRSDIDHRVDTLVWFFLPERGNRIARTVDVPEVTRMKRSRVIAIAFGVLYVSIGNSQQYPIMDAIAAKLVQKYQTATCEQLWQEKAKKAPPTQQQMEAIQILKNDPKMRAAFINKVAAPIANKMFECGLIP
jgi:hypothetical protein